MNINRLVTLLLLIAFTSINSIAQTITVQVDKPGAAINPNQFGVFFEDINFGADGGMYAELVKNRSFEFPLPMMAWTKIERGGTGSIKILERESASNNQHYLNIKPDSAGGVGVKNEGFRGTGIHQGDLYIFSVQARNTGTTPLSLLVELTNANSQKIGQAKLNGITGDWKKYTATIKATANEAKALLNVIVEGKTPVDLDMISLFPKNTFKGRPNGLRADLVQLLADLKPGFIRFPGGCIVEGRELATRYQWKTTIGDPAERKLIVNRWNTEFKTRFPDRAPADYFQSFGLGFYEYFQLCEDVGADPLPILNCGMACQFNTKELAPLDQLEPYIQDALDLIEFANGSIVSPWGKKRAAMGHPAPFNLKMIGIGNEQWGPDYIPRYEAFAKALKAKYPDIKLVSSAGPSADGERFDFLWGKLRGLNADLIDEHYYMKPDWFLKNAARYDNYDRKGPKVFSGEFAAQSVGVGRSENRNTWECALAEAAFMTGLERNGDIVSLVSYAPLFGHVEAWQWTPNLIWFDNLRSYGTPNYYVQKMFSNHRGNTILPVNTNGAALSGQQNLYASAVREAKSGEVILKIVNSDATPKEVRINLAGAGKIAKAGKAFVLTGKDLKAENSLDTPMAIAPIEQKLNITSPEFSFTLKPTSVNVLRIACSNN